MDILVKIGRFQIKQNVLNLKSTLAAQIAIAHVSNETPRQMREQPFHFNCIGHYRGSKIFEWQYIILILSNTLFIQSIMFIFELKNPTNTKTYIQKNAIQISVSTHSHWSRIQKMSPQPILKYQFSSRYKMLTTMLTIIVLLIEQPALTARFRWRARLVQESEIMVMELR